MTEREKILARNGWQIARHSLFDDAYAPLSSKVAALRLEDPEGYRRHPAARLLERVNQLVYDEIPANPADVKYRQGNTLGERQKHWFRAKFLGRFRLFFRFDSTEKVIIYCWLNDEATLRKSGSKTDPYRVFIRMIAKGNPPSDWKSLKASAITSWDVPVEGPERGRN